MNAIEVERITKRYAEHLAVDGASFVVPKGAVYGLLGPNGAGKTTSIRMILNILSPDSGSIRILGSGISTAVKDKIGYLPEERGLYPKMKLHELLVFMAEIKGLARRDASPRVDTWIERMGLGEWTNRKVEAMSKGMQQKVQFIATVIHQPEVLILDEPFSGLDPVNANLLKDIVLDLNRQGTTIVFSTHVMEQVERMCQSICLINRGRVVVEGRLTEIKQRYGTNSVALGFDGNGEFLRTLPAVAHADLHGNWAELRLRDGAAPRAILEAAMAQLQVKRFEVIEPTLNSIFIDIVGPDAMRPGAAPSLEQAVAHA